MTTSSQPRRARPRLTVRMRLTLMYTAIILLAGGALTTVSYFWALQNYPSVTATGAAILSRLENTNRGTPAAVVQQRADLLRRALDEQRHAAQVSLLRQSLLALGPIAAAAVGLGWVMAGRALRPVQRITETARRVAGRSLHERIGLQGPQDEFKELADTFDAMLERLDGAFDSQRRFVANASHELRTPLAINRTLLEVALTRTDLPADLRQLLTTLIATSDRSEQLLDGLLTLARSENELIPRRQVDLSDVAAQAVELTAREASRAGVLVDAEPDPAVIAGDPTLLERVALNLVQNGIRHNHDGGWVTVHTGQSSEPGWAEMVVSNTGPVVRGHDINDLFEPFRRLGGERSGTDRGVGLGLSIVRSVVHNHGGEVSAEPRVGGGLVVRVLLPSAAGGPVSGGGPPLDVAR